ncbi:MAG: adenylate/guanylate cyclase domain-containing protein [Chloroflexota bacterium]
MARLQSKSFAAPDVHRTPPKADLRLVNLDEVAVGVGTWFPGWRWSTDLKPIVGTAWCENHHVGYVISGRFHVLTEDGEEMEISGGDAYEIPPRHDAWVVGDEPYVTVEWTSARNVGVAPDDPGERIVATVLFTDIVDSTATLERIGDLAWRDRLLAHNAALREVIDTFRGREITATGDGFLAMFDGATRAVRCGAAMVLAARRAGVEVRVGVHTGEVELIAGNVRGVAVHTAARVLAVAAGGQIVVSETTRDLTDGSGLQFDDAGRHALKGLTGERQLYRLRPPAPSG